MISVSASRAFVFLAVCMLFQYHTANDSTVVSPENGGVSSDEECHSARNSSSLRRPDVFRVRCGFCWFNLTLINNSGKDLCEFWILCR